MSKNNQNSADELFNLGNRHYYAQGVKQSYEKALEYYSKAAEQGHSNAQYNLGLMYYYGRGVKQSYEKAFELYSKAAKKLNSAAQQALGYMYQNGQGVKQSDEKAVEWYEKSAQQGNANAQHNLGYMYYYGRGVEKSYEKAFELCSKAVKQGDADAQRFLGLMYYYGRGVEKSYEKAFEWYRKAAGQGLSDAQFDLGCMYRNGQGVEQNDAKAVEWYEKSAQQGYADAQNNLESMAKKGNKLAQEALLKIEQKKESKTNPDLKNESLKPKQPPKPNIAPPPGLEFEENQSIKQPQLPPKPNNNQPTQSDLRKKHYARLSTRLGEVELQLIQLKSQAANFVTNEELDVLRSDLDAMRKTNVSEQLEAFVLELKSQIEKLSEQAQTREVKEQISQLNQEIKRLEDVKADKAAMNNLQKSFTKLQDAYSQLISENQSEKLEEISRNLQYLLKEQGLNPRNSEEAEREMQNVRAFMQRHAQQLIKLSNANKIKEFEDAQVAAVLTTEETRLYYYDMISGLNQIHAAAMVSGSPYFTPNEPNRFHMFGKLLEASGKLIPVVGNYVDFAGIVVQELSQIGIEEDLNRFNKIARSAAEMDEISKEVAKELCLSHRGKLTSELQKLHLRNIYQAVFRGELEHIEGRENIVRALANVAEGKAADAKREKKAQSANAKPPKINFAAELQSGKANLKQTGQVITQQDQNSEDKTKTEVPPSYEDLAALVKEMKAMLDSLMANALDPELAEIVRVNARAAKNRLDDAAKDRDQLQSGVIQELKAIFEKIVDMPETFIPRMMRENGNESDSESEDGIFRKPRPGNTEELNIETKVNDKIRMMESSISEVFNNSGLDKAVCTQFRSILNEAILDRALENKKFKHDFLGLKKSEDVHKFLMEILQKTLTSNRLEEMEFDGRVNVAIRVVDQLAEKISPKNKVKGATAEQLKGRNEVQEEQNDGR